MQQITHNALMDDKAEIRTADSGTPNTFVDGRNALFLLYAAIYAKSRILCTSSPACAKPIFSSTTARDEFVKSMNVTLNLAIGYCFSNPHAADVSYQSANLGAGR